MSHPSNTVSLGAPSIRRVLALLLVGLFVATSVNVTLAQPFDRERPWSFSDIPRVVAVADVHGAYTELTRVLRAAEVIDDDGRWIGGTTHLVSTGDLVDRGPDSRRVLDLLMQLQIDAAQAGGKVHVLLGNHEVMVMIGDRRYVSAEEYRAFAADEPHADREAAFQRFVENQTDSIATEELRAAFDTELPPGFFGFLAAFAPEGKYGRWLLERNTLVRINGIVFVHGGIPPVIGELGIAEVNRQVRLELRQLIESQQRLTEARWFPPEAMLREQRSRLAALLGEPAKDDASGQTGLPPAFHQDAQRVLDVRQTLLSRSDGPLWYRGTARHAESQETPILNAVLDQLEARMVFIGHTPPKERRVMSRFGGRVLVADTGMLVSHYRGHPAAVVFEGGDTKVLYPDEGLVEAPRDSVEPAPLTDAQIESFLMTAPIVKVEEIGTGVTNPLRLTLKSDSHQMRAVFKTVNRFYGNPVGATTLDKVDQNDSFLHEVAAYRLDRLLGLNLVPVSVLRTVDGQHGAVQLWVEGAVDEKERAAKGLSSPDPEGFRRQTGLLRLFDALIYNEDRNQGNLLFTTADWKVHAIDHSRAFRTRTGRPQRLRKATLPIPAEVRDRMAQLDLPRLEEHLGELLKQPQLRGLLKRNAKLLRGAAVTAP